MDHYREYSAEEFALDRNFQEWVLSPTPESDNLWKDWVQDNPTRKELVELATDMILYAGLSTDADENKAYLEGWAKIQSTVSNTQEQPFRNRSRTLYVRYAALAAAVTGILGMVLYYRITGPGNLTEFKTTYAEVKEVQLMDGTSVTLNANSTLSFAENWDQRPAREVTLQGEAFFSVTHTVDNKPFIVHSPRENASVFVLGTTFNVNTRRNKITVYLESGKVKFRTKSGEMILQPGEKAEYSSRVNSVDLTTGTPNDVAWKSNQYIVNDVPLSEIVSDMEDTYGKEVLVSDKRLYTKRVTIKVPANNLTVLLEVLSQTLKLDIKEQESRITIDPRK